MLSRASLLSGQQCRSLLALAVRTSASTPATSSPPTTDVSVPRPIRLEPGKVRLGFVPEEWFDFFYKKTGVTGPYVFGVTLTTYLISKEIYVMEHEYYNGLSLFLILIVGIKKFGPSVATFLDKKVDEFEQSFTSGRDHEKQNLVDLMKHEEKMQWSSDGQLMLMNAKRENVGLQLEAVYRARLMTAYSEVKRRLDFQVEKQNIERRIGQKNLVDWVIRKVKASITPDQEKQNIDKCIADLALLAKV